MLQFEGRRYERAADETVLECLLRHGVAVASFCRSGACQTCVLKATAGTVPKSAQLGLKPSQQQQGYFLSCVCRPEAALSVERCDAAATYEARVLRVESLSAEVLRVWLSRPAGLEFRAGQFVQLERPGDGLMRPYSLASLPSEDELELHVARLPNGRMSGWLANAVGQPLLVRGPFGECSYTMGEPDRPLILAGTGTGLSPLLGVLREAAENEHLGPISLFHGSRQLTGLYLRAELATLAARLPTLSLIGSVLSLTAEEQQQPGPWQLETGELDQLVISRYPKPVEHRLFLCGNPALVQRLRKRAYLAGASLSRIHCDAFAAPHAS